MYLLSGLPAGAEHLQCRVQNTPSVVGHMSDGIKRPEKNVLCEREALLPGGKEYGCVERLSARLMYGSHVYQW